MTCLERDLVYARWWGQVDAKTRFDNFNDYLNDVHYRPGRPELIDLSRAELADWELGKIQSFLHHVNTQTPDGRVHTRTIIWAPTDDAFGTARMYQTLAEMADGITVELHRSEAHALGALGLPYTTIEALLTNEVFHPHEKQPPPESRPKC